MVIAHKTANEIKNLVRGLNPFLGAYSLLNNKKIKFWQVRLEDIAELEEEFNNAKPGEVLLASDKKGLYIKAKDGIISVLELQGENGIFKLKGDEASHKFAHALTETTSDGLQEFISNPLEDSGFEFDVGQLLSNIFGGNDSSFEPVMTFINDCIITPFTEGLNQFISNPLAFMADLGMGLGIGGLLNGLFGGENGVERSDKCEEKGGGECGIGEANFFFFFF